MKQLRESLTRDDLAKELGTEVALAWGTDINDPSKELIEEIKQEGFKILRDLDNKLKEYFEKKALIDQLSTELKAQNQVIVDLLVNEYGTKKYIGKDYSATVALTDKIKYKDEAELIKILEKDSLLKQYVIKTIDTKALNKQIKSSDSVATKLRESYTTTSQSSLTISKI